MHISVNISSIVEKLETPKSYIYKQHLIFEKFIVTSFERKLREKKKRRDYKRLVQI